MPFPTIMPRIFITAEPAVGSAVNVAGEDAHYLAHVLRLAPGDTFTVVTPAGREAEVRVSAISRGQVEGQVTALREPRPLPPVRIALYCALLKQKGFEWLLQKTTEVGAAEIYPLRTEHAVVQPREERLTAQVERWNKIVEAAGRQCESPTVPLVHAPRDFPDALRHWQAAGTPGLILELVVRDRPEAHLRQVLSGLRGTEALALFIGPEGGFSPAEYAAGTAAGLVPASLGTRVLRAETAATVATALCLYELAVSA
jgi:16S rRNA (uracil1498-N3)-methyltransferase